MIEFEFIDIEIPEFKPEFFVSSLSDLIVSEGFSEGDITVVFVTDEYLLDMNKTHLDHDYYTDIITFDYTESNFISGDLFISYDRVLENARDFNVSSFNELSRVVFHGVLHLCGYKDKSEEDEKLMRAKEAFYLEKYVSRETLS
ncbi:MAG: rRNA maturation RNase YbeY [Flavobacteriales bacterium]|nr:rRNA maturation RNase YbeY [Flavobacteriales bacterium]